MVSEKDLWTEEDFPVVHERNLYSYPDGYFSGLLKKLFVTS